MRSASASVGDVIRITTKRNRAIVARVREVLPEDGGGSIRFDRFARQALKAFPHEEVTVERVDLQPASLVVLTPAIEISNSHAEQLTQQVKDVLVEDQTPLRPGMLVYVKLPDGLAGITYDVHAVSGVEGLVTRDTLLSLSFDQDHEHGDAAGHSHEHQHTAERELDTT
jgi:hypothetical protein